MLRMGAACCRRHMIPRRFAVCQLTEQCMNTDCMPLGMVCGHVWLAKQYLGTILAPRRISMAETPRKQTEEHRNSRKGVADTFQMTVGQLG